VPDVEPGGGPYLSIRKTARPASSNHWGYSPVSRLTLWCPFTSFC